MGSKGLRIIGAVGRIELLLMGDFWDAWWQQTYQVKSIVLGNVHMLRTM